MTPLLRIDQLSARYDVRPVLDDISLDVASGEIVAILGANGAGKTSLAKSILGIDVITGGAIHLDGAAIERLPTAERARRGIGYVPEGRRVFPGMTVRDNLLVASRARVPQRNRDLEVVHDLFPILRDRAGVVAWQLSGGQQQMLAIGRALMTAPRLLVLDEPSLGLAPLVTTEVLRAVAGLRERGTGVLLCEQNVAKALAVADRGCVLELGRIVLAGSAAALRADPRVSTAFLGA